MHTERSILYLVNVDSEVKKFYPIVRKLYYIISTPMEILVYQHVMLVY